MPMAGCRTMPAVVLEEVCAAPQQQQPAGAAPAAAATAAAAPDRFREREAQAARVHARRQRRGGAAGAGNNSSDGKESLLQLLRTAGLAHCLDAVWDCGMRSDRELKVTLAEFLASPDVAATVGVAGWEGCAGPAPGESNRLKETKLEEGIPPRHYQGLVGTLERQKGKLRQMEQ
eukprot:gene52102-63588_t